MKKCIMTQSVVETIHGHSLSAFEAGKETGGILIGPAPGDETILITSATGPGPDDKVASYASWETDPGYLNEMLRKAREEDPAVDLRGFWHRHPGLMSHPSGQDLSEARRILKDTRHYKLNGELIMPIVTVRRGRVTIQCYYISRHDPQFREILMEVVSGEMVRAQLSSRKVIEIKEESDFRFWQDGDWQFYKSRYGAARLEEELEGLKLVGYKVAARLLGNGSCCIEAWNDVGYKRVLFLLPREYPLNPPQVYVKHGKDIQGLRIDGCSLLCRWSSALYLSELASVLGKQFPKCANKRRARVKALAAIKEEFRHGKCDVSSLLQQLIRFVRGEGNAPAGESKDRAIDQTLG